MEKTIEEALEILSGIRNRSLAIKLDTGDKKIIVSLANQVAKGTALTDRQLALSLTKISKYKQGLEINGVDVDTLLVTQQLRMPLREIDRTHSITLTVDNNKKYLVLKYPFSKKISEKWSEISEQIVGSSTDSKKGKFVTLNEKNIWVLVNAFKELGFEIDDDVMEAYDRINDIIANNHQYRPCINIEGDNITYNNVNRRCVDYINTNATGIISALELAKHSNIYQPSENIESKIASLDISDISKKVLVSSATKLRVDPEQYSIDDLLKSIHELDQLPMIILVDDNKNILEEIQRIHQELRQFLTNEEITVFFRLTNGEHNYQQFSQFVKDNGLNNYIDHKVKAVFIQKNKIPKPLFKAAWAPKTALLLSDHDYGKTSAYLSNIPRVYYYNNSISIRFNKIQGSKKIVNL